MPIDVRPVFVGDRRVYVGTDFADPMTQTINICSSENAWGNYELVFRIRRRLTREQIAAHETVTSLTAWLLAEGAWEDGESPPPIQSGESLWPEMSSEAVAPAVPGETDGADGSADGSVLEEHLSGLAAAAEGLR